MDQSLDEKGYRVDVLQLENRFHWFALRLMKPFWKCEREPKGELQSKGSLLKEIDATQSTRGANEVGIRLFLLERERDREGSHFERPCIE